MMYRKLKRVWSHGCANYIPNFDKVFPELKKLGEQELCDRFQELGIEFYSEKQTPVKTWIRFTLPFALLFMLLMIIGLPFNFFIKGEWGYEMGWHYNWLKQLRLI